MAATAINQTQTRLRYIEAFNDTMVSMWRERIALLGAVDTGALYRSVVASMFHISGDATDFTMEWEYADYGVYVERGTGREVAKGNSGDIGRPKVREAKPWRSKAFYSSVMNLKEFMAESLGLEAMALFSNTFRQSVSGVL